MTERCYHRLLAFFHSPALNVDKLASMWVHVLLDHIPGIVRMNGRVALLADGIKKSKEGKKMPAVKRLHQDSESNTKAEFINGHSLQVLALLAQGLSSFLAIPW